VATCRIVDLEILQAFVGDERSEAVLERSMFPRVPVDDAVQNRAVEVQGLVARRVPVVTLLVAAAAERAGLVLLHDDDAYDLIAAATGQPMERAVP
jgi:predicted nucleic acid-binding protein